MSRRIDSKTGAGRGSSLKSKSLLATAVFHSELLTDLLAAGVSVEEVEPHT